MYETELEFGPKSAQTCKRFIPMILCSVVLFFAHFRTPPHLRYKDEQHVQLIGHTNLKYGALWKGYSQTERVKGSWSAVTRSIFFLLLQSCLMPHF